MSDYSTSNTDMLADLFQQYVPTLRGYIGTKVNNEEDVEDILQDAFVRLMSADELHQLKSPKSYLITVVNNLIVDLYRRSGVRNKHHDHDADPEQVLSQSPNIEQCIAAEETLAKVEHTLSTLPPRQKKILLDRQVHGRSYSEISSENGLSIDAARHQVSRGIKTCKQALDSWENDAPPSRLKAC